MDRPETGHEADRREKDRTLPLIEFPEEPLDWSRLFPSAKGPATHSFGPVQVEIGAGKGRFLIRAAEADPGSSWVGLEVRWAFIALAVERIVRRGLGNALYVRCDASEVVRRFVPPGSVAAFHVYYPDPWWKERHRKRRVFTSAFVADLARGLRSGGHLRVATDVRDYFEEILAIVTESGLFEPLPLSDDAWQPGGEPLTSYEAKYQKQGRTAHRAAFVRNAVPAPPAEPWLSRRPRPAPLADLLLVPRTHRR